MILKHMWENLMELSIKMKNSMMCTMFNRLLVNHLDDFSSGTERGVKLFYMAVSNADI